MSLKIWILTVMFGITIYPHSSAKFCLRRYVNGKWISKGDCGGPVRMSEMHEELRLRAENENKWTIFQRRMNGDVDFFRGWDAYVKGFGKSTGDFWLGLEKLHEMTKDGNMELEIKMITQSERTHWVAKYSNFIIGPGSDNYRLHVSGFSGNASNDGLAYHNNYQFTTKDEDHDVHSSWNCASYHEGGWWYKDCANSNLNGNFHKTAQNKGIWWYDGSSFKVLRYSEMKFRTRL